MSPRGSAKAMPGARLSRFARRVARRACRCGLPGCGQEARALRCCGKALCAQCRVHTLRASLGRRLVSRCPFCRRVAKPRAAALKRMMAVACPSHALVVETEGGPPSRHHCGAAVKQAGAVPIFEPFFAHGYRRRRGLHTTRATVMAAPSMLLTRVLLQFSAPAARTAVH